MSQFLAYVRRNCYRKWVRFGRQLGLISLLCLSLTAPLAAESADVPPPSLECRSQDESEWSVSGGLYPESMWLKVDPHQFEFNTRFEGRVVLDLLFKDDKCLYALTDSIENPQFTFVFDPQRAEANTDLVILPGIVWRIQGHLTPAGEAETIYCAITSKVFESLGRLCRKSVHPR